MAEAPASRKRRDLARKKLVERGFDNLTSKEPNQYDVIASPQQKRSMPEYSWQNDVLMVRN